MVGVVVTSASPLEFVLRTTHKRIEVGRRRCCIDKTLAVFGRRLPQAVVVVGGNALDFAVRRVHSHWREDVVESCPGVAYVDGPAQGPESLHSPEDFLRVDTLVGGSGTGTRGTGRCDGRGVEAWAVHV